MADFGAIIVQMALKISAIDNNGTYFECHAGRGTQ
jgi:hypothetical protein